MLYNSGREDVLILTMHGYLPITRTVLRPIDDASKQKLKKLTGRKSVVPMDIMLGIDALPFKITRDTQCDRLYWCHDIRGGPETCHERAVHIGKGQKAT